MTCVRIVLCEPRTVADVLSSGYTGALVALIPFQVVRDPLSAETRHLRRVFEAERMRHALLADVPPLSRVVLEILTTI